MMRPSDELACVYLCKQPVDMRKSINGLAALVEGMLALNPFSEHLFIFANRRRDKLKILYWERSGFVLWYKRLERERFKWPVHLAGDVVTMTAFDFVKPLPLFKGIYRYSQGIRFAETGFHNRRLGKALSFVEHVQTNPLEWNLLIGAHTGSVPTARRTLGCGDVVGVS